MVRSRRRARVRRREDGAVMLVVMLILLTATALAGVALQATEYELRAAGFARSAMQTTYVADAAMNTTLSWVETLAISRTIEVHLDTWAARAEPNLQLFAEPRLTASNRALASRTTWTQQAALANVTLPPITAPGANNDPVGTFGPRVTYQPGTEDPAVTDRAVTDYVVDMYDCQWLTGLATPGAQVNQGGSGTIKTKQLYCVMTARGRSFVWDGAVKVWADAAGNEVELNRFTLANDARGTFVSPSVPAD